jgi:hypothetical protein
LEVEVRSVCLAVSQKTARHTSIKAISIVDNKSGKMVRYYTADEIMMHNCAEDCWVSIFDTVYDITALIQANRNALAEPLIKEAGRSVSHWFDKRTGDVKMHMDSERNIEMPFTPNGRFIHVPPSDPCEWSTDYALPWWKDEQYIIGKVSTAINERIVLI